MKTEDSKDLILSSSEISDLLSAIEEARDELCIAPGFLQVQAYDERLRALSKRLRELVT